MTLPQPSPTPTTPGSPSLPSPSSACCSPGGCTCSRLESVHSAPTVSTSVASVPPSKNDSVVNTSGGSDWAITRRLTIHRDSRGNVRETFRASWFPMVPPIQQLVRSKSKPKTLRGMHLHRKQWDVWHFVKGAALVRLYYHGDGSNTFLWMGPGDTLAIPPGVSHGFYTPDGCILLYALTEEYDGTDEYGWHFADGIDKSPRVGLDVLRMEFADEWPVTTEGLNISDRDTYAPSLAEFDG